MPTKSTSRSTRRPRAGAKSNGARPRRQDAIAILKADHREVEKLFKQFEKASGPQARRRIAESFTEALAYELDGGVRSPTKRLKLHVAATGVTVRAPR